MATEVMGTKRACPKRGVHIKQAASTADVTGVKMVGKNFAKPGTRFYGFLGAFIGKAKRVATVRQMVDAYHLSQDAFKMVRDAESVVIRDLANYLSAWTDPTKTGSRGLHLNVVRVDGTDVHNTDPTAKYEFISVRADSKYAAAAGALGWPVG